MIAMEKGMETRIWLLQNKQTKKLQYTKIEPNLFVLTNDIPMTSMSAQIPVGTDSVRKRNVVSNRNK